MNLIDKYREVYDKYIMTQEKFIELEMSDYYFSLPESERIFQKNTMSDSLERLRAELKDLELKIRVEEFKSGSLDFKSGESLREESFHLLDELMNKGD